MFLSTSWSQCEEIKFTPPQTIITPTLQELSIVRTYNGLISLKLIHLNFLCFVFSHASAVVHPPWNMDSGSHYLARQVEVVPQHSSCPHLHTIERNK